MGVGRGVGSGNTRSSGPRLLSRAAIQIHAPTVNPTEKIATTAITLKYQRPPERESFA